jgi:hypothetical protein
MVTVFIGDCKSDQEYGGTDAGNLAHFYAGDCYLRTAISITLLNN